MSTLSVYQSMHRKAVLKRDRQRKALEESEAEVKAVEDLIKQVAKEGK